jgi:hypothetical protein
MSSSIVELFTIPTLASDADWQEIAVSQHCAYLNRKCIKTRKSEPEISIGTCSIRHGVKSSRELIVCPQRFLERGQIFLDCLHLLTLHEPGNELHTIAEIEVPGGSVDYFLVSAQAGKVIDFVGIELQALDTTGTLWPARQQFLASAGAAVDLDEAGTGVYGVNWKMTAKTTLMQLHHKIETFEGLGKHLVLVVQDALLDYMRREFMFSHIKDAKLGHAMHFHSYRLHQRDDRYTIQLDSRKSTDAQGIAQALGRQADTRIELEIIQAVLESKLSERTLLRI